MFFTSEMFAGERLLPAQERPLSAFDDYDRTGRHAIRTIIITQLTSQLSSNWITMMAPFSEIAQLSGLGR